MKGDVKKWIEKDGQRFLMEIGIKKGQTVLDFGCGEGHYTVPVSKVVDKDGKVYALDKDRNELEKLKEVIQKFKIKNIEVINPAPARRGGINEGPKIPLEHKFVDVVLCYDVIHYENRKERKTVYNEIHRVLKKEGFLSVYPKHHKEDSPLMELANVELIGVIKEIEEAGFILEHKFSKKLLHDEYYNKGYILNFRKYKTCLTAGREA